MRQTSTSVASATRVRPLGWSPPRNGTSSSWPLARAASFATRTVCSPAGRARQLAASGYELADTLTRETLDQWGNAPAAAMLQSASVAFLRSAGFEDDLEFILSHVDDLPYGIRFTGGELVRANE